MGQKLKYKIRDGRITELKIDSEDWKKLGVEIFKVENFQYQFIQGNKIIDYYPISGKWHNYKENKWGICPAYDFHKFFLK